MQRWARLIAVGLSAPLAGGGCKNKDEVVMQQVIPHSTGASPANLLDHPLRMSWRVPVSGSVVAAPAGAEGLVVVPSLTPGNAGTAGAVEAFDVRTGARRWVFDRDAGLEGGVATTPVVADGLVVFGTTAGVVQALHVSTGQRAWRTAIGRGPLAGIAVRDGTVVAVGEGTKLHALELRSGTPQWEASVGTGAYAAPAVDGPDVYVASEDGTLRSIGPGGPHWQLAMPVSMPVLVAVAHDVLLVSALSDRSLRAVDRATHAELWAFTMTSRPGIVPHAPVLAMARGVACVGDDARIVGLALATGKQVWALPTSGELVALLAAGDVVIAASRGGDLVAVHVPQGNQVWSTHLEQPVTSGLLFHEDTLFLVDATRQLVAMVP